MVLRADHVAGGAFVAFGALIIALSGDLPTGQLSMPGSGFLPKLIAVLMIVLGAALVLRAGEGETFAEIDWSDGAHALKVIVIAAAAIALYTTLGFILTLSLMMVALLVGIERRHPLRAAIYSVSVVVFAYVAFSYLLKTPLPNGIFGY